MHSTYFKNRLRRARRDALDAIKHMKLPEDDEKKEREVVEKTLAQVIARIICVAASRRRCFAPLRNALASHALAQYLKAVDAGSCPSRRNFAPRFCFLAGVCGTSHTARSGVKQKQAEVVGQADKGKK